MLKCFFFFFLSWPVHEEKTLNLDTLFEFISWPCSAAWEMLEGLFLSLLYLCSPCESGIWAHSWTWQARRGVLWAQHPTPLPTICACGLFLILRLLWSVTGGEEKNLQAPQELWKPLIKSYCQCRQTQFTSFPGPSFVLYFCSNFPNTVCRLVWPSRQPGSPWPTCCPAWGRLGEVFCELCGFLVCCFSARAGPGPANWSNEEILW